MGDAVTGINRADWASWELNSLTLRQYREACNSSHSCGHFRLPDWQALRLRAASTADSACRCGRWPSQTAYPPPRESCVRGADRAAVDKRFRSPICCASAASLFGKSGKLSTATFFAASPSSARAAASASARVMPPSNSMIAARFLRASRSKSSSAASCFKKLGTLGTPGTR